MFSAFERMVAMRYLRARRQEGFISVIAGFSLLGIGLGVATLIIVMSVMNGFRHEILSNILGMNGHLAVYAGEGPLADFDRVGQAVAGLAEVRSVMPTVEGQVMVTAAAQAAGALVRGVRPEDLRVRPIIADNIVAGSLDDFAGEDVVAIGSRLARRLGLAAGDSITAISPQVTTTIVGSVPRMKAYRVVAIFQIGNTLYDDGLLFMPLEAAQLFFKLPDAVSSLEVTVADPDRVEAARADILAALGPGYRLVDWQQANASFFTVLKVERNVMALILTLIILVAAFNIVSGMIMLVKDKGRDIAILRTMGATRGMVMRIFLLSGASIGVVGTGLGFALGLAFAENIETIRQWLQQFTGTALFPDEFYFLSQLPAIVDARDVTAVVGVALVLSFLATLYPSWRAARLDPVEALRYE